MTTTADSSHIPASTGMRPSVTMLKRNPEARSWTPRYGIEKNRATMTVRTRMVSDW